MNGVLIIDKPTGLTSHDVVNRVRRILQQPPWATWGRSIPWRQACCRWSPVTLTRLAQFYGASEKTYEGVIRFGFATDTYDSDGEAREPMQMVKVSLEQLQELARGFVGIIEQMPPPFSAKKIKGVPAYKLARKHQDVPLMPVPVEIREFEILGVDGDQATFRARVASGTYMRSVAHDMGQQLGCGAHLQSLRRTRLGEFDLSQAHTLDRGGHRLHRRQERRDLHSPAPAIARFPVRHRQRRSDSADSQRPCSELAGIFPGAASESIRRAKGTDRHRYPDRGNAVPSQDRAGG